MSLDFLLKSFSPEDQKPKQKRPKDEVNLAGVLQRQRLRLKKKQQPRPQSEYFSPSTITYNFCARARILQLAGRYTLLSEIPTPKLQLRFDIGTAIHEIIQNYYWDCGMLEGDFFCIKCDRTFYARSPEGCPYRKSHERRHLKFKEFVLTNKEYRIRGRCDGFVWVEKSKTEEELHIQDIKSIQNRTANMPLQSFCFEDLDEKGPKDDHVVQLNMYLWMANVKHGHLLYVGLNSQQIKSIYVPYDYSVIEPYLSKIKMVIDTAEAIKRGEKPELPAPCSRADCPCESYIL